MPKWYQGNNSKRGEVQSYQQARQYESPEEDQSILGLLQKIEQHLRQPEPRRLYEDQTYVIGNTQSNLYLNYRGRKHLYMYSGVALTLNLQDIGTLAVPAATWTDISFRENMQLFTTNQATAVAVWVRATDEIIETNSVVLQPGTGLVGTVEVADSGGVNKLGVGTDGSAKVQGNIAAGAVDSGNPVEMGGLASNVQPATVSSGQRQKVWLSPGGGMVIALADINGSTAAMSTPGDTQGTQTGPATASQNMVYTGGGNWDRLRTPNIFKTTTATTTGDNALWTPAGGKKFRLMGFLIDVTANAAISGGGVLFEIILRDGTNPLGLGFSLWVPTTTVTTTEGGFTSGWCVLGNGPLSAAANNVLNLNLSATLTSGEVRAVAIGIEE